MDWFAPINSYCERTDAAFWSEPVNALSNLAFLLAAAWAFRHWRRRGAGDRATLALVILVAVIGVGSALFHTFADRWSLLADVLPIAVFIYGYFALAMRRFAGLARPWAAAATLAFLAASQVAAPLFAPLAGSSAGYVPAFLAMVGIGAPLRLGRDPARRRAGVTLLLAAGAFALSLLFRTLDGPACAAIPLGLHFLWHILNAAVLALLLRAAIDFGPGRWPAGRPVPR